jgi:hypothetical protein
MTNPQREPPSLVPAAGDRLGYYMVKVRRSATDPSRELAGVVERLASGEKREFRSWAELARVVEEWSR